MNIQIVLFDGFDLMDALGPYEVFEGARLVGAPNIAVELVCMGGARPVPSAPGGLVIAATGAPDLDRADIILIPGAAGPVQPEAEGSLLAILAREGAGPIPGLAQAALRRDGLTVVAVCGGALILGLGGVIEGRHAVTHFLGMPAFAATGAIAVQARVVDDGNLITGGGVTSGIDVALHVVDRFIGPKVAHGVESLFEYERRGIVWRPRGPDALGLEPSREDADAAPTTAPAPADQGAGGHTFAGLWHLRIHTPIGVQEVQYEFVPLPGGRMRATARKGSDAPVQIDDVTAAGGRITWSQRIPKPLKLDLRFDVAVTGDSLTGSAKAGVLPGSRVEGVRLDQTPMRCDQ